MKQLQGEVDAQRQHAAGLEEQVNALKNQLHQYELQIKEKVRALLSLNLLLIYFLLCNFEKKKKKTTSVESLFPLSLIIFW